MFISALMQLKNDRGTVARMLAQRSPFGFPHLVKASEADPALEPKPLFSPTARLCLVSSASITQLATSLAFSLS